MGYLVTGATGFVGGQLVRRLLAEHTGPIHCLVREASVATLEQRIRDWGTTKHRIKPVVGDLTAEGCGLDEATLAGLADDVDHVFHLAAIYDVTASAEALAATNVEGTRHLLEILPALAPTRLHHVSSIAVAGTYPGEFTEEMFEEATGLDHPYFATKHASERLVREDCEAVPWRVYRPGIVVGDSRTGETDKADGPYYAFKLLQRLRQVLPPWVPLLGPDGPTLDLVPVDFVVDALDHIAHLDDPDLDGQAFHLTDPDPRRLGEIVDLLADEAGLSRPRLHLDVSPLSRAPFDRLVGDTPLLAPMRRALLERVGIPDQLVAMAAWPTTFDTTAADKALAGSGIEVPPLEAYIGRLWTHWERHLDTDRKRPRVTLRRDLEGVIRGKVVLVTGASEGIGREVARQSAAAGAHVALVARTRSKLEALRDELVEVGGSASVHPADLSEPDDVARMADEVLEELGGVDVLVNNAGRSIRRSVRLSFDRFHDIERTISLNYLGAVRLLLALLPRMLEHGDGHIINVSSIGVQTNVPRFSAYVASKDALDAYSRCIASEVVDDGVRITTVYMPLVRTKMIAPTKLYDRVPAISPDRAGEMVCEAMIDRPKRVATALGTIGEVSYAAAPKLVDRVLHVAYRLFPDSAAAQGGADGQEQLTGEGLAFARILRGVHW